MNALVALAVIAVAGATFVFSYSGVHAIALLGGVSTQLARYYPALFDAVLVIACIAAVVLTGSRWWARLWAWVVVIVVLGAIGTADVLHAMNYALRHRPTEGIVAAAPVAAVLLAFSLLLTLLRQAKPQARPTPDIPARQAAPIALLPAPPPALKQDVAARPAVTVPAPSFTFADASAVERARDTNPAAGAAPTRPLPVLADTPEAPPVPVTQAAPAPQDAPPEKAPPVTEPETGAAPPTVPAPTAAAPSPEQPAPPTVPAPTAAAPTTDKPTLPTAAAPTTDQPPPEQPAPPTVPAPTVAAPTTDKPTPAEGPAEGRSAPSTVEVPAATPAPTPIRYANASARAKPPKADYWDVDDTEEVPALNRVRSTPIPPEEDEDDEAT